MVINDGMGEKMYAFVKFYVVPFAFMCGLYNPSETLEFKFKLLPTMDVF
jgi:hypothetical protein